MHRVLEKPALSTRGNMGGNGSRSNPIPWGEIMKRLAVVFLLITGAFAVANQVPTTQVKTYEMFKWGGGTFNCSTEEYGGCSQ